MVENEAVWMIGRGWRGGRPKSPRHRSGNSSTVVWSLDPRTT